MSDIADDLRARLARAELPAAPETLRARVQAMITANPTGKRRTEMGRTGRLLLPIAAVIAIAGLAVSGGGRGPTLPPTSSSDGPNASGPANAALTVKSSVYEWCGSVSCEYQVELDGPAGASKGFLQAGELGGQAFLEPALPNSLTASGTYTVRAEIHVAADVLPRGSASLPDRSSATCASTFTIDPSTTVVELTLGFWRDRCAAGTIATANPGTLAGFLANPSVFGKCGGDGGCEYRMALRGPTGTWAAVSQSPRPPAELARSEIYPMLPPGRYELTASAHELSADASPGPGDQAEISIVASCVAVFVVDGETLNITASVQFQGDSCTAATTVEQLQPGPRLEVTGQALAECHSMGGCAYVIDLSSDTQTWHGELTGRDRLTGSALPRRLDPGTYSVEALKLYLSDDYVNGHPSQTFEAARCDGSLAVATGDQLVTIDVTFRENTCSIETRTSQDAAPIATSPPAAPTPSPFITCPDEVLPSGIVLQCSDAADAVLTSLQANHPPIDHVTVERGCPPSDALVDCATQVFAYVEITYQTTPSTWERYFARWTASGVSVVPVPSAGARPLELWTAAQPAGDECPLARASGVLAQDPRSGLAVAGALPNIPVRWPFGYTAWSDGENFALVDADGNVVAERGWFMELTGGFGEDDVFQACSVKASRSDSDF